MRKTLDREFLLSVMSFDFDTGKAYWKNRKTISFDNADERVAKWWNTKYSGTEAGTIRDTGHIMVLINKKVYPMSHLFYFVANGIYPDDDVRHKNYNTIDNRPENLYTAPRITGMKNQKIGGKNTSGFTGVCWISRDKRWRAAIKVSGETIHLGQFKEKDDAIKKRVAANIKYGFHKDHGATR